MAIEEIRRTPPYGPAKGMLEGLRLLQRLSPTVVDQELLRQHAIARGNEYKVIGALRYLGLVDEDGRPTDRARLLKAKGALLTLNLQQIVRDAYPTLFRRIDLKSTSRDDIYNHFLADLHLAPEMAAKATRFFIELARSAGFAIGTERPNGDHEESRRGSSDPVPLRRPRLVTTPIEPARSGQPALSITLPTEALSMSEDDLAALFRRVVRAWNKATE